MIPVIILSSHTIGLGAIRALGIMGVPIIVIYYQKHDMGYVSKYVQESLYAPHPEESEDEFVSFLIECASRFGRALLVPVDDATLGTVSRHKALLERHYIVACTEWNITEQFIVKKHTYALADTIGVPAPRTFIPPSLEDAEKYGKTIEYPCMVKPCEGHRYFERFRKKMTRVGNFDQMIAAYCEANDAGLEVMLQELIPGDDTHGVNYNSYFWQGDPLVEFTAEKVRLAPPGIGVPRVAISKRIPEVIEVGRKVLRAMGFYGYSCMEFKRDARDGVYKLMEVNGRHNLSSLLCVRCGINFPWIMYQHMVQDKLPSAQSYQTGVYWIDMTKDLIHSLKHFNTERYSVMQYLKPYFKPHVFAILDWKDPKPFLKRCIDIGGMAFRVPSAPFPVANVVKSCKRGNYLN